MDDESETKRPLDIFNHLTIDERMKFVSPLGLGSTNFNPLNYVDMCLSPKLSDYVPQDVRDMFDRAKATMSYGVYHYPLFTAGMESIHRLLEAALYHFAYAHGCTLPEKQAMFFNLLQYCKANNLIRQDQLHRWDASHRLRNMASHQKKTSLHFANTAVHSLQIAKELIEPLFVYGPPHLTEFFQRCADEERRMRELQKFIEQQEKKENGE